MILEMQSRRSTLRLSSVSTTLELLSELSRQSEQYHREYANFYPSTSPTLPISPRDSIPQISTFTDSRSSLYAGRQYSTFTKNAG
jgi:hypothetical protein